MILYQYIISGLVLIIAFNFMLNCFYFRKPRNCKIKEQSENSFVSVLIPARNEEGRIGKCLESLVQQHYENFEILVLNDHSSDQTELRIIQWAEKDSRIRLIQGKELPVDWTGKGWACQQLGEQAQGDLFLFTDADTWHNEQALASAVSEMQTSRADLVSLWPRQVAITWSEILVIPFVHVLLLFFLPHWMPGKFRSLGAANGQYLLFRKSAYKKIGGHATVKGHLVDDVALAREVKVRGLKLLNLDGSALVSCRMYENVTQLWEGFTKNLRAGFEDSVASFLFLFAIQSFVLCFPFFALAGVFWFPEILPFVALQLTVIFSLRVILAFKCKQPIVSCLFHPFGQLFVLAIALNSWMKTSRGGVSWKGRNYSR
jgi:chlorobactene glucosyltransferase